MLRCLRRVSASCVCEGGCFHVKWCRRFCVVVDENKRENQLLSGPNDREEYEFRPYDAQEMRMELRKLHGLQGSTPIRQKLLRPDAPVDYREKDPSAGDRRSHPSVYTEQTDQTRALTIDEANKKFEVGKEYQPNYDKVLETSYGNIRLDIDNSRHREKKNRYARDTKMEEKSFQTQTTCSSNELLAQSSDIHVSQVRDNLFDSEYFLQNHVADNKQILDESSMPRAREVVENTRVVRNLDNTGSNAAITDGNVSQTRKENIFDEHYFPETFASNGTEPRKAKAREVSVNSPVTMLDHSGSSERIAGTGSQEGKRNLFDEDYFPETFSKRSTVTSPTTTVRPKTTVQQDLPNTVKNSKRTPDTVIKSHVPIHDCRSEPTVDYDKMRRDTVRTKTKKNESKEEKKLEKELGFTSAAEAARSIRAEILRKPAATETRMPDGSLWKGHLDSKGFRNLKHQVVHFRNHTKHEIAAMLKRTIIYEDDEVIAINKPYGLASHGGPGVLHSVGSVLKDLANILKRNDTLSVVHRLDKETTGVMLLARNAQVASRLHHMFVKRRVIKRYWAITKGVPDMARGIVDIPMAEGTVGDLRRMTLRPNYTEEIKDFYGLSSSAKDIFQAITKYNVLSSGNGAAFVECMPETGVKHQIRCHLAFALNTPIIGDHKYSHLSKIAPQKLYAETLRALNIRQAKVRHVPMHLHARSIVVPEWTQDNQNLFVSAPPPRYFMQNLKWLKLELPADIKQSLLRAENLKHTPTQ